MKTQYTDEKNTQILISLLKAHGIKKIIASPGATNVTFVGSVQSDPYFEVYSSVDERSAAYIACGLAEESGEPVVISCTGATASQNYMPGLIEAFYRKLPILTVTSTQPTNKVSHLVAQVTDRSIMPNDTAKASFELPVIKDEDDLWACEVKVNNAILELKRHGGGPVHINLVTTYSRTFSIQKLPESRVIKRFIFNDTLPELKGKVAIFLGSHSQMTDELTKAIDNFCDSNDAVVFCDHTSGYYGKHKVLYALAACQTHHKNSEIQPDILIHLGEVSGDYPSLSIAAKREVWRVNVDGEIRDTFRKLRYVFEMPEEQFFLRYIKKTKNKNEYLEKCLSNLEYIYKKIPELPFSNIWIASQTANKLPKNSVIHFGILNSLRSWNLFKLSESIRSYSNVGGFGIDGNVSSLLGASLASPEKLYFGVVGDLAFFYDLNAIGNRHLQANIRIMLINNGKGTEFRNFNHSAHMFGENADNYIAAAGHFGNKSKTLVRDYSSALGFEYLCASTKEEYTEVQSRFLTPMITHKPMLLEIFTESQNESDALEIISTIERTIKGGAKDVVKKTIGNKGINILKKVIRK